MKKVKKKSIFARLFVFVLALVIIVFGSGFEFLVGDEISRFYRAFVGNKSEYNGVIEIWNIDSFEGGTKPKVSYIEYCANRFQNDNKGTYVVVRNLTENESVNLINGGVVPDLISCSYGVSDKFKDYICAYSSSDVDIDEKFLKAGKNKEGELLGLSWCFGYYFLISTKAKIEKAKILEDNPKLNEIAYSCDYEFKSGKKTRKSVSLAYGTAGYLMPHNALIAYNKARSIQTKILPESELSFKSQYSAFCSYLANDATILLGTQRDAWKMLSREESGKVSNVIYLPLNTWTDIVQYVFVLKTSEGKRRMYAEKFAYSLVDKENQKEIESIGMFPVWAVNETTYNGVMRDIILEKFSDLEPKCLFE